MPGRVWLESSAARGHESLPNASGRRDAGHVLVGGVVNLAPILAIIAALLIAGGRLGHRWPIAIVGYVVLALAATLVLLGAATGRAI